MPDHVSLSRALDVVGARCAMHLILEASAGTTRFDQFVTRIGMSEAVVAKRLRVLTEAGVLERRAYQEDGQRTRFEYVLTDRGREVVPTAEALAAWGDVSRPSGSSG